MPLVESNYRAPLLLANAHVQTCLPSLFRKVTDVRYEREFLDLPDGAFLRLDWSRVGARRLAILSHGWEGHTRRAYVLGMVRALNRAGWDCLAWLFRWCDGVVNRTPTCTHNGAVEDVRAVVDHALATGAYDTVALVGFSMGGNLNLNYLGREPERVPAEVRASVGFSVPAHLDGSAKALGRTANCFYHRRFLKSLCDKIHRMAAAFPEQVDATGVEEIASLTVFDDRYTAPLHGFVDAADYRRRSSSLAVLPRVRVPSLIVDAANDSFLSPECYPYEVCRENPNLYLEVPATGGHCGFIDWSGDEYWSEARARSFLAEAIS
jgi:predicted alpha/beta-fold hydrolase